MPGRPNLNRTRFNASLPDDLLAKLDMIATIDGVKRPDVIETALTLYVAKRVRQGEKQLGLARPPRRRSPK